MSAVTNEGYVRTAVLRELKRCPKGGLSAGELAILTDVDGPDLGDALAQVVEQGGCLLGLPRRARSLLRDRHA